MHARRDRPGDKDQKPLVFDRIFILGGRGLGEDDWRSHFSQFGNIKSIFMKKNETGGAKGQTHIKFEKTSQACLAQESMDGRSLPNTEKPIKVLISMDKNSVELDCEEERMLLRLFLRFPKTTTKEQLKETFSAYGDVTWCHVLTSRDTGENRGLGFVKFAKQSQAALALEECDPSFRARWADVRAKSEETSQQAGGGMRGGGDVGSYGGMGSLASGMMDIIQSKSRLGAGGFGAAGSRAQRMGGATDRGMGGGFGMSGGLMDNSFGMGGSRTMGGAMRSRGRMGLSDFGDGMMGGSSGLGGGMMGLSDFEDRMMGGSSGLGGRMLGGASGFGEQEREAAAAPPPPPKPPAAPGDPMYYIESRSAMGSDRLQAKVPEGMNLKQAYALFNICPGLTSCSLNPKTGIAKLQYESAKCASFAQEKTNGLNYAGHLIECDFGKISGDKALEETAAQLQQTLMQMTMSGNPDPEQLSKLVESIQKTTEAIEAQGDAEGDTDDDTDTLEMVSWCSVPLPKRKPFASGNADIVERLFFVSVPDIFSNDLVEDAFCRFGNLIKCRFQADKRFGFAHYATKESADLAQKTLHGESILNNHLKVEYASKPGMESSRSVGERKRPADW